MRGPNPIYVGMFKTLGASATTTDWSEICALQTGVIDGLEASPDMLLSMKFNEQAKYLSKTSHIAACVYYDSQDWLSHCRRICSPSCWTVPAKPPHTRMNWIFRCKPTR